RADYGGADNGGLHNAIGILQSHLQGHRSAHGMAEDWRLQDAEGVHKLAHHFHVAGDAEGECVCALVALGGVTKSPEVERVDAIMAAGAQSNHGIAPDVPGVYPAVEEDDWLATTYRLIVENSLL